MLAAPLARPRIPNLPHKNLAVSAGLVLVGAGLLALHQFISAQGSRWASPLRLVDWLFTVGFALGLLTLAWSIGGLLRAGQGDDPLADELAAVGIGGGVLSLVILAAGLCHLLHGWLFASTALVITIALYRPTAARIRRQGAYLRTWRRGRPRPALTAGRRIVVIVQIITLGFVCLRNTIPLIGDAPDLDGVTYHLAGPALYVHAHAIIPLPDIPLANGPSGLEMLAIPGVMAGTDTLLKVLNLLFALLLGLAIHAFSRRHFPRADAGLAVILFYLPTWIVELMAGTVVDFATAFLLLLGAGDALAWLERQRARPVPGATPSRSDADQLRGPDLGARVSRPASANGDGLLVRAGLLLGFAVSFKLTSGPAIPTAIATLGLCLLVGPGGTIAARLATAVRAGAVLGAAAVLPLAPWLLKSRIWFHNALYPAANLDNGSTCAMTNTSCAAGVAGHAGDPVSTLISHLWWMLSSTGTLYWNFAGPLTVALLLVPTVRRARPALLFLVIGAILWLSLVPLFYPPRYWLAMLALAAVLTAVAVGEAASRMGVRPRLLDTLLLVFLLPASLYTLVIAMGLAQRSGAFDLATGRISPYTFLADRVRPYKAMDWVNTHVPPGAEVAMVNSSLGYYLRRPYLNDWYGTRFSQLEQGGSARRIVLKLWCAAGVHYAIFNHADREYNQDNLAGIHPVRSYRWVRQANLVRADLFSWRGVDVLAVSPCGALASTGAR